MIIKIGQEPIEREPDAPDNLTEREPKSAMIASPGTDDCEPQHLTVGLGSNTIDANSGVVAVTDAAGSAAVRASALPSGSFTGPAAISCLDTFKTEARLAAGY